MAFLRTVADPDSSVDLYALAASDVYGIAGEDLTAIVNTARRRNRSVREVIEELERQPGILRVAPATRDGGPSARRRPGAVRRPWPTSDRPARCCTRSCATAGCSPGSPATTATGADEGLGNVARFFDIVRAQSGLLADDRAVFVARHLQTLIDAGDDPATADLDPDADAVAVLTVHKAKGLEFPVVYLPGLVAGRFPGIGRGDPLALPAGLGRGEPPDAERSLAEERRLFYVAMTRARDELILSHAADYGGARARRISPFVLEALDLPPATADPGDGRQRASAVERLAAFAAVDLPGARRPRAPSRSRSRSASTRWTTT